MGAPKQKWTAEEEAALKAGVVKHGAGKWRTILTDPEFSNILRLRSNVDLKDKWRNINVMINGLGSRSKARLAVKKIQSNPNYNYNHQLALGTVPRSDEEVVDAKPLAVCGGTKSSAGPKEPIARLEKVILDSIRKLNEPGGSDKAAIAKYIEEQCCTDPDFKKQLGAKLKHLTANGKLMKVKHKYRIVKRVTSSEVKRSSPILLLEGGEQNSRAENGETNKRTKSQIDEELMKMRSMTPQEAAAAAAQAVAEAEAAIAEAAEAAREAEEAEAEAEAAEIFAKAALKALKSRTLRTW